jgi:hypothetical protein
MLRAPGLVLRLASIKPYDDEDTLLTLRVVAPDPVPAERDTPAVATAIRVLERFPALEGFVLLGGGGEASLTRADVERLLAPLGFAALRDRGRWPQVLARAVRRYSGSDAPQGAGRLPQADGPAMNSRTLPEVAL